MKNVYNITFYFFFIFFFVTMDEFLYYITPEKDENLYTVLSAYVKLGHQKNFMDEKQSIKQNNLYLQLKMLKDYKLKHNGELPPTIHQDINVFFTKKEKIDYLMNIYTQDSTLRLASLIYDKYLHSTDINDQNFIKKPLEDIFKVYKNKSLYEILITECPPEMLQRKKDVKYQYMYIIDYVYRKILQPGYRYRSKGGNNKHRTRNPKGIMKAFRASRKKRSMRRFLSSFL